LPLAIKGLPNLQINVKEKKKVVEAAPPEPPAIDEKPSLVKIVILIAVIGIVLFLIWSMIQLVVRKRQEALIRKIEGGEPSAKPKKSLSKPEENGLMGDMEKVEEALPEKREEEVPIETEDEIPPVEKEEVILEPEESIPDETTKATQAVKVSDVAEMSEEVPEISSTLEEVSKLDIVPEETVRIRPDFDAFTRDEKPEEDIPEEEISEVIDAPAEEEPKATQANIMEDVEALLQKHLNAVLADRMKQIEEDVLTRVRDELAGRMNDTE
jgi:hypothetical protein